MIIVVSIGQRGDFITDESGCRTAKKGGSRAEPGYMPLAPIEYLIAVLLRCSRSSVFKLIDPSYDVKFATGKGP